MTSCKLKATNLSCQSFVTINALKHIFGRQCRNQMDDQYFKRNRMMSYKLKTTNIDATILNNKSSL